MAKQVNNIINNAIKARDNIIVDEKKTVYDFAMAIKNNLRLIQAANDIDLKNNNGFKLDYKIFEKLLNKYIKEEALISHDEEMLITDNNLINSNLYSKLGIVLVKFDGNTYTLLEMILLGLLTHNTMIFSYDGYMHGTNGLLINLIQAVLEKLELNKYMYQDDYQNSVVEYFKNFKTINKTVIIGDGEFIADNLEKCTTEVITCGYDHYDLYIEDLKHEDVIRKIVDTNKDINVYLKEDLELNNIDYIKVTNVDEAITRINHSSSLYSSAIFTDDRNSIISFINEINSDNIFINTSPTLEQSLSIKQIDLLHKKNVTIPNIYSIMDHD